jgi:hypothetical protein
VRSISAALVFCLVSAVADLAYSQAATPAADSVNPRVFALVAAVGQKFDVTTEVQRTGSHLTPYRHTSSGVQKDVLNRIALNGLDKAVAAIDPDSKRIYLTLSATQMDGVEPSQRENVAIGAVVAALEKMPQRLEWDRIVVATPAYRRLELQGLAGRLQGFGLFLEPLCQGCDLTGSMRPNGAEALTSDGETIEANTYVAPFSYIDVWILDPKTLAVLDKQERFDSQKLAEPKYRQFNGDVQKYLVGRLSILIEHSIGEAVAHSEINDRHGRVEVGEPKVVDPAGAAK